MINANSENNAKANADVSVDASEPVHSRVQAKASVQPPPDFISRLCEVRTKDSRKSRHREHFEKQSNHQIRIFL